MAPQTTFWTPLLRALGLDKSGPSARDREIEKLIADLKDPMPDRRRSAAWSLGKKKPVAKAAIEPLAVIADKDPDPGVRHSAQWALKAIRGS
jgi:HEAT repeat protein